MYTGFIEFRWDIYERTKWIEWHFYRIPLRDFMLMGKKILTEIPSKSGLRSGRGPTDWMHLKTSVETFQESKRNGGKTQNCWSKNRGKFDQSH